MNRSAPLSVDSVLNEAWCNCQGGPDGPWHPFNDTPSCPQPCASVGPRIRADAPHCINPRGHFGDHLAHSSWHHEIKRWS